MALETPATIALYSAQYSFIFYEAIPYICLIATSTELCGQDNKFNFNESFLYRISLYHIMCVIFSAFFFHCYPCSSIHACIFFPLCCKIIICKTEISTFYCYAIIIIAIVALFLTFPTCDIAIAQIVTLNLRTSLRSDFAATRLRTATCCFDSRSSRICGVSDVQVEKFSIIRTLYVFQFSKCLYLKSKTICQAIAKIVSRHESIFIIIFYYIC